MTKPPPIQICTREDHPARRHGHYGYGGRYWCADLRSPLLSEENLGVIRNGYIVLFEKKES
ncbi:MAG TPA: hypothetical protein VIJ87_02685 [Pyrinomonadaceae bacterium]|jgi:hypothetical protein